MLRSDRTGREDQELCSWQDGPQQAGRRAQAARQDTSDGDERFADCSGGERAGGAGGATPVPAVGGRDAQAESQAARGGSRPAGRSVLKWK